MCGQGRNRPGPVAMFVLLLTLVNVRVGLGIPAADTGVVGGGGGDVDEGSFLPGGETLMQAVTASSLDAPVQLPIFLEEPVDAYVIKGKPATLTCRVAHALTVHFKCNGDRLEDAMAPLLTDFVDPQTGVRNVEVMVNITRNHVEEFFGKHNYQCQCVAWTSRGEIVSRPATVVVASDKDDVLRYAERLSMRTMTVDVLVTVQRDLVQQEALHQVNGLIDSLVVSLKIDPGATRQRCAAFMNACSSHGIGLSDKIFETAILGCTLDDQKRVKKRLQGLLDYIDKMLTFEMQ